MSPAGSRDTGGTMNQDAIIIGGGIMGANIALALAERGFGDILVVEKTGLAAGSTGKSGAILRQHYSHAVTIRMARAGLGFYSSFAERTGRDIGFRRSGMIFVTSTADRAALERNVSLQQSLGVDTRLLEAPELRELEPRVRFDDDVVAAWEPEAGYVSPLPAVDGIMGEAVACGVTLRIGEAVTDIVTRDGAVRGVTLAGGETVEAPVVVNAGGPWAGGLMRRLGLDYPLEAIRPQQAFFEAPPGFGADLAVCGDLVTGIYWKPESKGWTRVGDMAYADDAVVPDPDDYDEGASSGFIRGAWQRLVRRLPDWRRAVSWGGCGALYTVTPDAHALIGEVPAARGLWLVAGFSGHGFKMGPAVGTGVAAMITGDDPAPFDPEFFALNRFDAGKPVTTSYSYGILG